MKYSSERFYNNITKLMDKYAYGPADDSHVESLRNDLSIEVNKAYENRVDIGMFFPITIELKRDSFLLFFQSGHVYRHEGKHVECLYLGWGIDRAAKIF